MTDRQHRHRRAEMTIDTKALRELLQHATEGEWRPQVAGALDDHVNVENMDGETLLTVEGDAWERWDDAFNEAKANAHLVAAMKNALPELLDAYDRLSTLETESIRQQAEIKRLQDELIDIKALVDTGGWYLATAANVVEKALAGEGGGE